MILAHEFGHMLAAMAYGIKYHEIEWKAIGMIYPNRLSKQQKNGVLVGGIAAGLIPLFLMWNYGLLALLLLAAYAWGCMKDIKKFYVSVKK